MRSHIYLLRDGDRVFYVGCTTNVSQRLAKHRWRWGREIEMEVLEETDENWKVREVYWIAKLRAAGHPLLNKKRGGGRIGPLPEETCEKLSEAQLGNSCSRGKNLGNKYAAGNTNRRGAIHTEDARARMSAAQKTRWARQRDAQQ